MLAKILSIIQQISKLISENADRNFVLQEVSKILASNLDSEVCSIYIYESATDELVLRATSGLNKSSIGEIRLKPGNGITGYSFKYNEIINVAPPEKHPKHVFFKSSGEEKFRSILSVPLLASGHCVGVLNLQRIVEKRFPPSVVDLVKSSCAQVANLILASRMIDELSESKKGSLPQADDSLEREQRTLRGISASSGVAEGRAVRFERHDYFAEIMPEKASSASKELIILEYALKAAKSETVELEKRAIKVISEADASIFNVHILFLEDKTLIDSIRSKIEKDSSSIEFAIKQVNDEYQRKFESFKDPVFREKASDLKDVLLRLLAIVKTLRGSNQLRGDRLGRQDENQVIVTVELLPSDIMRLPLDKISGIACEKGGVTSHIAILAKALSIPLLLGVKGLVLAVAEDDELIIDCHSEILYVRPSTAVRQHYAEAIKSSQKTKIAADKEPAFTSDGAKIAIRANVSLLSEAANLAQHGAEGIGLYRTEFLFMIRDHMPSEDVQSLVYSKILRAAKGEPVAIRTLDIGADKPLPYLKIPPEENPALGWRGTRVLLAKRDILRTQLSAILKVAAHSNIRILFPMVSTVSELIEIKQTLSEVEYDLHAKKIPHADSYKIGIMLEVPSAVIALDELIKDLDFMSIGSNDLLMYTFAADRNNEYVASLIKPFHPAFLKLLKQIGAVFAKNPGKGLSICGEMASMPHAAPFLIGAGIREFSMSTSGIAGVKRAVRAFSLAECSDLLNMAISFNNADSVLCLVKQSFADKGL